MRLVLIALALSGCGRSSGGPACEDPQRVLLLAGTFDGGSQTISLGGTAIQETDRDAHSGTGSVGLFPGEGSLRTAGVTLESRRAALGFWLKDTHNGTQGTIEARISTDGGKTFVASSSPMPSLGSAHGWSYTEALFHTAQPGLEALFEIVATTSFVVEFDDVQVFDLESCAEPAPLHLPTDNMLWVTPSATLAGFWIDIYEAIVEQQTNLGALDQSSFPDMVDPDADAFASSRAGATPRGNVTWYQARGACVRAGKRLCTSSEHERACRGEVGFRYPYGDGYIGATCNVGSTAVHPSGNFPNCVSRFGVYDLVGNLWEWIEGPAGGAVAAGDSYNGGPASDCSGHWAQAANFRAAEIGFRCCRDE